MSDEYIIREACREDCPRIREMIQELANYEKVPDGPKIDVKTLEEDGFGPHTFFHCFVAENTETRKLNGYALFFYIYSTWEGKAVYMEDLYVSPEEREKGVGRALIRKVAQRGLENGCSRLDFAVFDWNIARDFYKKVANAHDLTDELGWHMFRITKEDMIKLTMETRI